MKYSNDSMQTFRIVDLTTVLLKMFVFVLLFIFTQLYHIHHSESRLNFFVFQFIYLQSLFAENKEKLIVGALQALTQKDADKLSELTNHELEASFHTLRRLLASKVGFGAFTNLQG